MKRKRKRMILEQIQGRETIGERLVGRRSENILMRFKKKKMTKKNKTEKKEIIMKKKTANEEN